MRPRRQTTTSGPPSDARNVADLPKDQSADPTTHQLRQRIEGSLSADGDGPPGRKRNTLQKRGTVSAEATGLGGGVKKKEGFHENPDGSHTFNGGRGDDEHGHSEPVRRHRRAYTLA